MSLAWYLVFNGGSEAHTLGCCFSPPHVFYYLYCLSLPLLGVITCTGSSRAGELVAHGSALDSFFPAPWATPTDIPLSTMNAAAELAVISPLALVQ